MSIRSIVRELKEMRDGIGSMSRRGFEGKSFYHGRARSCSVFELHQVQGSSCEQGDWANLPQELLVDVIRRIEARETSWPARKHVVVCAAVCRSWREVTKEIVKTPEQCGRLTFPISLKQPGPRDSPIQCFIRRERETSMFYLYLGLSPGENGKLLLSARKIRRRPAPPDFLISLDANDFSRTSNCYVGKLSSGLFGNKFTVYGSQPQNDGVVMPFIRSIKRLHSKKISPKLPAGNFNAATITYEFNVLGTRGPRRMRCTMNSIPISCIQDGGAAPTPMGCPSYIDESFSMLLPAAKFMDPIVDFSSTSLCVPPVSSLGREEPLTLKNKAPRWHEQLQCWCLNFRGRVTVASVKNFQLVAEVEPSHQVSAAEQDKVILQFGKIGRDIFTMDYRYPLSAFQAFAICLSSFDTKFACE